MVSRVGYGQPVELQSTSTEDWFSSTKTKINSMFFSHGNSEETDY
jgi:hypothetical protein